MNKSAKLKPALVLGSGFHQHVLGETSNKELQPLFSWHELVTQAAGRMQVAVPSKNLVPVHRWESLVLGAVTDGYRDSKGVWHHRHDHAPYMAEKGARRAVASILKDAAQNYPPSTRAQIPLNDGWGTVISLNFDHAWLPAGAKNDTADVKRSWKIPHHLLKREFDRLTVNQLFSTAQASNKRRVWFPNGACALPHTIRMGVDDYGSAPHSIQVAYNRLKQWEREAGIADKSAEVQFHTCTAALLKCSEGINNLSENLGEPTFPLSWVAEFLYRPIIFAGVGLSTQEIGLWWLLSKRARNMARLNEKNHVYILQDTKSPNEVWNNNAFGITPIYCDNWDTGWQKVLYTMKKLNT